MFYGPDNADIPSNGGLLAHLFGDLREMADDGGDTATSADEDDGFERFEFACETAVRPIEEGGKCEIGVLTSAVVDTTGKASLRLEDENEIIDFAFAALRIGSYGEWMVIEERYTGDADKDMLAGGPTESSRNSNLDTIVGEELHMACFPLEGTEEVGSEEKAVEEASNPDDDGSVEVMPL